MKNHFKTYERFAFVALFLFTIASFTVGLYSIFAGCPNQAKWIGTAGLLATITGVVQLEVSGFFDKVIKHYMNEEEYPYGPPSYITREIIDNPDRPVSTWLRNVCFFSVKTGFWLIVLGTMSQVCAVWL